MRREERPLPRSRGLHLETLVKTFCLVALAVVALAGCGTVCQGTACACAAAAVGGTLNLTCKGGQQTAGGCG